MIDYSKDYIYDYFGFKTLERAYLIKIGDKVIERPQDMLLRVASFINKGDLDALKLLAEHYKQNNDEESSKLILDGNHKTTKDYKRIFPEKCSRCLDKYIESSKRIDCIHKDICNECTKNLIHCPKCETKYE